MVKSVRRNTYLSFQNLMEKGLLKSSRSVSASAWNITNGMKKDELIFLRDSLKGNVPSVLCDYEDKVFKSLFKLTAFLKQRFVGQSFPDKYHIKLRNQLRQKGKTLQSLYTDIRRMAALAYMTDEQKAREVIATDCFLDAIGDPKFALRVRDRQPQYLDFVLAVALQIKV